MAKHKGGRKPFRRFLKGVADERTLLTTLAARTLFGAVFDDAVTERTYASSIVATYTMDNWTPIVEAGPIMVGVAHSDYTDAEVEAVIENLGSWEEGSLVEQEIAKRKVRVIGIFDTPEGIEDTIPLNEGRPIKTKLGWILLGGQTLRLWGYNLGQAAVATTVPNVYCQGYVNLWPQ